MHEVAIIQSALDAALEQARCAGAARVHRMKLRVGELSGVVPDALRFAYDAVCRGTMAEGSQLEVETIAATCWCSRCEREFISYDFSADCPRCHTFSSELRRGRELEITSLEIS